eukprot:6132899-Amphidinium_carterae.2
MADNFVLLRAKLDAHQAQRPAAAALGDSSRDEFQHEGADRITAIKSRTQLELSPSSRDQREAENNECQAGLRNAARAVLHRHQGQQCMKAVFQLLVYIRRQHPSLQHLSSALGSNPSRPPPSPDVVRAARAFLADVLSMRCDDAELHHPASPWRWSLLRKLAHLTQDPEVHAPLWLRVGAPVGIACAIPPSGLFPAECHKREVEEPHLAADPGGNHWSFDCNFGEELAPGLAQILEMESKGFVTIYPSLEVAESACGKIFLSPLGNLRKQKHGRVKDRLITDLRVPDLLAERVERIVMPRALGRGMALLRATARNMQGGQCPSHGFRGIPQRAHPPA